MMDDASSLPPRRPGRPKSGVRVRKITVMLTPEQHDWAMAQPEGLSGVLRRLITEEQARQRRQIRRRT